MCRVAYLLHKQEHTTRFIKLFKKLLLLERRIIFLLVTYTIIQSINSSEMCSLHLTHLSAHTPGAVGSRHCSARGAVGGSVPCSRVSPQSWTIPAGVEIWTHNLGLQVQRYPLGHGCRRLYINGGLNINTNSIQFILIYNIFPLTVIPIFNK